MKWETTDDCSTFTFCSCAAIYIYIYHCIKMINDIIVSQNTMFLALCTLLAQWTPMEEKRKTFHHSVLLGNYNARLVDVFTSRASTYRARAYISIPVSSENKLLWVRVWKRALEPFTGVQVAIISANVSSGFVVRFIPGGWTCVF